MLSVRATLAAVVLAIGVHAGAWSVGAAPQTPRIDLRNRRDAFVGVTDREHRATTRPKAGIDALDRELDVRWVMLQPSNDQDILDSSGDEEPSVPHESQISGSKERAFTRSQTR